MPKSKKVLVIACIPAYNEEATITNVIKTAEEYVDLVIVCDDGSTDRTSEIAKKLGALVIKHGENKGYGAALRSLFLKARELEADVMVTLDADGQHDPRAIPMLIEPILSGKADIVIGSRFLNVQTKKEIPLYRRIGIYLITILTNFLIVRSQTITDAQSGFRAYGKKALKSILPRLRGMCASIDILWQASRNDLRIVEVPVSIKYFKMSRTSPIKHGLELIIAILRLTIERWLSKLLAPKG